MEFLSQYDATIRYLPADKNTAADALSRLPEQTTAIIAPIISCWWPTLFIVMQITSDTDAFLHKSASQFGVVLAAML